MEAAANTQVTHLVHVEDPIPTDKNKGDLIYPSQWEESIGGAWTTTTHSKPTKETGKESKPEKRGKELSPTGLCRKQ